MKKQIINIIISTVVLCIASVLSGFAQNSNPSNLTNSAYTRYGFGKLGSVGNAANRGMGDLGVVAYSNSSTNLYNPASLTAIDTLTMLVEAGLNGEWAFSTENGKHQSDMNAGFNYLSLHFPLWYRFAGAVSLTPYSMVGYYYGTEEKVPVDNAIINNDTLRYTQTFQGNGGLQKVMMSLGWKPIETKKASLSVGLNGAFIYGSVTHGGTLSITSGQGQNTIINRSFTARGFDLTAGLQYIHHLNASKSLLFGATFSPETNLKLNTSNIKYSNNDTVLVKKNVKMKAPTKLGFGVSYLVDRKLQAGAEFSMEKWGNIAGLDDNLNKTDGIYKNITKFAAGIDYQPSTFNQSYFKTCHYRAGVNVKNSYVETYGSENKEYTVSAGVGLPIGLNTRRRSFLNLALEYTHVQPSKKELLKEDYINLTIGVSFNEMMFFRNRLH